jgi:hypothetical protein
MDLLGIDSCFLSLSVDLWPASGSSKAALELKVGMFFAKASLLWQMDPTLCNTLGLCDGVTPACGDTKSLYCSLGQEEFVGLVTFGIDFFLFHGAVSVPIGEGFYRNCDKDSDGTRCLLGSSCNNCRNPPTYWFGMAFTACGVEPKYADGTLCLLGTSCNQCAKGASYWYSNAFTACGSEPKWADGTLCALGTSCNACTNPATFWTGPFLYKCGVEPKWSDGTLCAAGTTCNQCTNGSSYWFSKAFTACGTEPGWADGTSCAVGTSCNARRNAATFWTGPLLYKCGKEPCWPRGSFCGLGTTCGKCCHHNFWETGSYCS